MKLITFFRRRAYPVVSRFNIQKVVWEQSTTKNIYMAKSCLYEFNIKYVLKRITAPPEKYFEVYAARIRLSNGAILVRQIPMNKCHSKNVPYQSDT
jgi:hypothetical protein